MSPQCRGLPALSKMRRILYANTAGVAMTSKAEISNWFDDGLKQNATHMIVVCDTYDHEDFPIYAFSDDGCVISYNIAQHSPMQRVMEVYDLRQPKEAQMNQGRAFRLPSSAVSP
jgi:hypothetical protein